MFHFRAKVSFSQVAVQLRQGCGNQFLLIFLVFGAFHFPFKILFKKVQNCAFSALACFGAEIRFWI